MQILSHRGFHVGAADVHENTHAAFERAIQFGVDGIETDIRLSADGEAILFHDRVAPGNRPVASLTQRELAATVGYEIPTLNEILSRWPDIFWNLEVKCGTAVAATIDCVKRHPHPEKILVSSFRHDIVRQCADQLDVACGLIVAHAPIDVPQMLGNWQPITRVRTIVWDFNVVDAAIVRQAQRSDFKVYAYGAVTAQEHQNCQAWGLDGIITDFPDRALWR